MSASRQSARALALVGLGFTPVCLAQAAATLIATHDHPTGLVAPGETVHLTFTLSWTGALLFAEWGGHAVATPNIGVAENPQFHPGAYNWPGGATVINPGTPSAGSVLGVDIQSGVQVWFPGAPFGYSPWFSGPITMLNYDWTAPATPGLVVFDWSPLPGQPDPLMYLTPVSLTATPVSTSYLGTSLTVVPGPAAGLTILATLLIATPRRR